MPGLLAVAAYQGGAAVARYVAKHGVKKATEKYGKAALKKVASKKTAKSAATKAALVTGEGAAVKAVKSRQSNKPKARRKSDGREAFESVASNATDKAIKSGAKAKILQDQREKRKRLAAAKKAAKGVKGPIAKRRAMMDELKKQKKLPKSLSKREQQNADMKDKMAAKKKATKARSAAAKKAVANAKGPVAKRRAQYDALKSNTKMSKRFASRDRQNAEMKKKKKRK